MRVLSFLAGGVEVRSGERSIVAAGQTFNGSCLSGQKDTLLLMVAVEAGDTEQDCRGIATRVSQICNSAESDLSTEIKLVILPFVHLSEFPSSSDEHVQCMLEILRTALAETRQLVFLVPPRVSNELVLKAMVLEHVATTRL